jgi:hypothetical protein
LINHNVEAFNIIGVVKKCALEEQWYFVKIKFLKPQKLANCSNGIGI